MTKYKQYVARMLENNKELFDGFRKLHDRYASDQEKYKEGERVSAVIREWEDKLCRQSEKAGYGSYTSSLAEKFQAEVKKVFPLIDHIGLIIQPFAIKKITL